MLKPKSPTSTDESLDYREKHMAFTAARDNDVIKRVRDFLSGRDISLGTPPTSTDEVSGYREKHMAFTAARDENIVKRFLDAESGRDVSLGWMKDYLPHYQTQNHPEN